MDLDSRFASEFSALVKRGELVFTPSIAVRREGGEKEPSQPFLQFVLDKQKRKPQPLQHTVVCILASEFSGVA